MHRGSLLIGLSFIKSLGHLLRHLTTINAILMREFDWRIHLLQLKKHMVTASYVDESMSNLSQAAKGAGVTILCEMGLDPGIGMSSI